MRVAIVTITLPLDPNDVSLTEGALTEAFNTVLALSGFDDGAVEVAIHESLRPGESDPRD